MLVVASTDLQKEIVEGERVSHTVLYLNRAAFVSEIRVRCSVSFIKSVNSNVFCLLRVELPLKSSMPETLAGPRDSSLLPRLWGGEPQRWCKLSLLDISVYIFMHSIFQCILCSILTTVVCTCYK